MKVFLSYNRADAVTAKSIADDLEGLGHVVWYDREISGGQSWWDTILRQIRECDLFILLMTPKSLNSEACRAEYGYAGGLQKRILPVLCHDDVRINLLPPELLKIQFVDYCAQDKGAAFAMVKALQRLPDALPLPEAGTSEPPIPQSYLGGLRVQIETAPTLSLSEQSGLLMQIKERLGDPELREDAFELLRLLRNRNDLLAAVDRGIAEILADAPRRAKRQPEVEPTKPPRRITPISAPEAPPESVENTDECTAVRLTKAAVIGLMEQIAAAREKWLLQAGNETVAIDAASQHLVVSARFTRWTQKEFKLLRDKGWETEGRAMQGIAAGAIGVFGAATSGLGLGVLLHKGTRDYICNHCVSKRYALDDAEAAAAAVREAFQVLAGDASEVLARRGA